MVQCNALLSLRGVTHDRHAQLMPTASPKSNTLKQSKAHDPNRKPEMPSGTVAGKDGGAGTYGLLWMAGFRNVAG